MYGYGWRGLACLMALLLTAAGFYAVQVRGWLTPQRCLLFSLSASPPLPSDLVAKKEGERLCLRWALPFRWENWWAAAAPSPSIIAEVGSQPRPLILIYNTHTGEAYAPSEGIARKEGGKGGVVQVAATLARELERHGFEVIRSDKIHDACYATSYLESEKTAQELLAAHPEAVAVFDIHRDSRQPPQDRVLELKGQAVAHVLIVVGSGERQPFPTWEQNRDFAQRLAAKAETLYPGLCRGVRVKGGRYNQHLHPRALLFEMGGVDNTLEEAERAAVLWAEVVAAVLREELAAPPAPPPGASTEQSSG
ncbi:stage II sporulation protein P [Desulfothermobacter acidiphilus]|uniref:stage II sporulation protein P n=1 Tax=Desulfothermobacter acidiphilus TaxID=1938353 RepID=UPI003F8B8CFE